MLATRQIDFSKNKNLEPTVSLIITAHNEEEIIKSKLENSLVLNYPLEKLQIIIASDGSTDGTVRLAEEHHEVEVLDLSRMGKTAAQNEAVKRASGDIVVFSDANAYYEPNAVRELVKWFVDSSVGCVCGELRYRGKSQEGLYWKYEVIVKELESRAGRLLGANGSIYAIRKTNYINLSEDVISDFVESLKVFENGKYVLYEEEAIAWEDHPSETFQRKRRIILRSLQSLKYLRSLLNPSKERNLFWQLVSHKILRWFMPFILISVFITNAVLLTEGILYKFMFLVQVVGYLTATVNRTIRYILVVNAASFLGIVDWIRGKKIITWSVDR